MLIGMCVISALLTLLGVALTLVLHGVTRRKLGRAPPSISPVPPISILKPLKGMDDDLYENLTSFTRLDYPNYEIIFGAADWEDPAIGIARRIQRENPTCNIKVVFGAPEIGFNPKVSNLAHLARFAEHEWLLISDSNVRPQTHYLRDITQELTDPEVGLVHCLLGGVGEESLGATLENLHMSTWVPSVVANAEWVDHPCVIGKSMLFRRESLEAVGGFYAVRNILAEDYVLGRRFVEHGLKVKLASMPLLVVSRGRSLREFANRHLRWSQMRRRINPAAFLGEVLLNPTPFAFSTVALAALAIPSALLGPLAVCCFFAVLLKTLSDMLLACAVAGRAPRLHHAAILPLKDIFLLGLWLLAAFRTKIVWRGNVMCIGAGSRLYRRGGLLAELRARWSRQAA